MYCPICLDQIGETALCLPCGHVYCTSCVEKIVEQSRSRRINCPSCRQLIEPKTTPDCIRKVFLNHSSPFSDVSSSGITSSTPDAEHEKLRVQFYATKMGRDEIQSNLAQLSAPKAELSRALERCMSSNQGLRTQIVKLTNDKSQLNIKLDQVTKMHEAHQRTTAAQIKAMGEERLKQQREIALLKEQLATAMRMAVPVKTEPTPRPVMVKAEPVPVVIKLEPTTDSVRNSGLHGDRSDRNSRIASNGTSTSTTQPIATSREQGSSSNQPSGRGSSGAVFTFGIPSQALFNFPSNLSQPSRGGTRAFTSGLQPQVQDGSSGSAATLTPNVGNQATTRSGHPPATREEPRPTEYTPINVQSNQARLPNRLGGGRPIPLRVLEQQRSQPQVAVQPAIANARVTPSLQQPLVPATPVLNGGSGVKSAAPASKTTPTTGSTASQSRPASTTTPPVQVKRELKTGSAILYRGYGRPQRTPVPECTSSDKYHNFSGKGTNQYATRYTCGNCHFVCSESRR